MSDEVSVRVAPPEEFSSAHLDQFEALVSGGGQVDLVGLRQRIFRARLLCVVDVEGECAAVGALKVPWPGYHKRQFKSAGAPGKYEAYPIEVGWVFVEDDFRRRGLGRRVVQELLGGVKRKGVFATVRSHNAPMLDLLKALGFRSLGPPYESKDHDLVLLGWTK
jgi:GNAT superfamily N-acetyltransferase